MRNKAFIYLVPFLLFIALSGVLFFALGKDPKLLPSAKLGKPFPEFELPSLHKSEQMLSKAQLTGEVVLVNVWATWCVSCLVEHPMLTKLSQDGVIIHGLNYKDVRPAAITFLENHGNPYRQIIFDEAGGLGLDLGVYGAPETYFLDKTGQIRYRHVGIIMPDVWQNKLQAVYQALLQE
ncbi:MAG TPA: DsbE family thiol:disulfide interchange protein [Pseudomonadales bacterium]